MVVSYQDKHYPQVLGLSKTRKAAVRFSCQPAKDVGSLKSACWEQEKAMSHFLGGVTMSGVVVNEIKHRNLFAWGCIVSCHDPVLMSVENTNLKPGPIFLG